MQDQAGVGRYPATIFRASIQAAPAIPLQLPRINDDPPTVSRHPCGPGLRCRADFRTTWRHRGTHPGGGPATLPRARPVPNADGRHRRAADRIAGPHAGRALGARSLRGMGPCQPAPRAVRVRPRLAARAAVGSDDGTAIRSARRVRRRVVALDQRRVERTCRVRRRQDGCANRGDGRGASRGDGLDAPAAGRVRRPRPAAARTGRSTGADGQPGAAAAAERDAGRRADAAAEASRGGRGATAERVPRWHGRRHR